MRLPFSFLLPFALLLALSLTPTAAAETRVDQVNPVSAPPLESLDGAITVTQNALNGQLALGRGNLALNANLTDSGPEGQLQLGVPGQFALMLSVARGATSGVMCGVLGPQEVTVNAGRGSGVRLEFHNAADAATSCARPDAVASTLTMAPILFAQASPPSDTPQEDVLNGLRRFALLAGVSALLMLFAPGLRGALDVAARSRPWTRFGLGVCVLIALPVLGAAVFVVGIPLGLWWIGLLVLMFFACLLALGFAMAGLVLGDWLMQRVPNARVPAVAGYAVGLALVTVLGLLPSIGTLFNLVALAYGSGAVLLLGRGRQVSVAPVVESTTSGQGPAVENVAVEAAPPPEGVREPAEAEGLHGAAA